MKISLSLPSFLLFEREKWEDQLEKFEGNSLSFSFLFSVFFLSFDPSSFQFLGGGMERDGRIKKIAFWRIIHFYKNKTKVEKTLYIKGFRHSGRIFDTVLIPLVLFS